MFEIIFKTGEGKVKSIWKEYEIDGFIGVRRKGLRFDWENAGGSGWIKEDIMDVGPFGLIAYESESGGGLMLWAKGKPVGDEFKLGEGRKAEEVGPEKTLTEQIEGKEIKVRRSVKGIWGEKVQEGGGERSQERCKPVEDFNTTNKVIYKNYGMLQADGMPVKEIKVLDWIHWGSSEIKNSEKLALKQRQGARGRYDYYALGEKITKIIAGPLKEIRVNKNGISDGKGNQIKWSDKFKPEITVELKK